MSTSRWFSLTAVELCLGLRRRRRHSEREREREREREKDKEKQRERGRAGMVPRRGCPRRESSPTDAQNLRSPSKVFRARPLSTPPDTPSRSRAVSVYLASTIWWTRALSRDTVDGCVPRIQRVNSRIVGQRECGRGGKQFSRVLLPESPCAS